MVQKTGERWASWYLPMRNICVTAGDVRIGAARMMSPSSNIVTDGVQPGGR